MSVATDRVVVKPSEVYKGHWVAFVDENGRTTEKSASVIAYGYSQYEVQKEIEKLLDRK